MLAFHSDVYETYPIYIGLIVVVCCFASTVSNMKPTVILAASIASLLGFASAKAQSAPVPAAAPASSHYSVQGGPAAASGQSGEPVSYASVSQLNGLLAQLESASKSTQSDLVKLRIEHWKTDSGSKKQALANIDSIQRNLQGALPEMISGLRAAPEDLPATFKLYRNLDALYDVLGNVVELTGAFGTKDDVQALSNDLSTFEGTRKQIAARIENLSTAKEAEIVRLRSDLKTAQAAIPVTPPKKIVVDDTEPPKKPPVKKKPAAKTGTTTSTTARPSAAQTQNPPAQQAPQKPQ
jgi:hypothetical protein